MQCINMGACNEWRVSSPTSVCAEQIKVGHADFDALKYTSSTPEVASTFPCSARGSTDAIMAAIAACKPASPNAQRHITAPCYSLHASLCAFLMQLRPFITVWRKHAGATSSRPQQYSPCVDKEGEGNALLGKRSLTAHPWM